MTTYSLADAELETLRDKTIVITGAASGIGRAAARMAHGYGAKVVIGDWNEGDGGKVVEEFGQRVLFRKTDVSNWEDLLSLFEAAEHAFGEIHAVLSNAGINTEPDIFADEIDSKTGRLMEPNLRPMDINLKGMIYASKLAVHYFSKVQQSASPTPCQLVITGSAASIFDTPPQHLYCTAKAGLLGFMRSLRTQMGTLSGGREGGSATVNIVLPWFTVSNMTTPAHKDIWGELPINQPEGVARALLLPICRPQLNGKAFFVSGHEITEIEDKLEETRPLWIGKELSAQLDKGQEIVVKGMFSDRRKAE